MLVVIDTNVMLSALARHSPYAPIFSALTAGKLRMAASASILLEYEEIAAERGGVPFSARVMHLLSLVGAAYGTVVLAHPAYQFQVVTSDSDDNKFTDCAITAHADFVITNDHDFAPLAKAGYKPQPIRPEEFIAKYLTS